MRLTPVLFLVVMVLGCGDGGTTSETGDPLDPSLVDRWIDVGRYKISGNSMILYASGGGSTLWER